MSFERFTESGKGFKPKISIRPSGTIGINDSALKKYGLASSEFVALFYDAETRRIAIAATTKDEPGSHKLNLAKKGASISAKRFLDYYDLNVKSTTQYECSFDLEAGLVILDREIKRNKKAHNPIPGIIQRD